MDVVLNGYDINKVCFIDLILLLGNIVLQNQRAKKLFSFR